MSRITSMNIYLNDIYPSWILPLHPLFPIVLLSRHFLDPCFNNFLNILTRYFIISVPPPRIYLCFFSFSLSLIIPFLMSSLIYILVSPLPLSLSPAIFSLSSFLSLSLSFTLPFVLPLSFPLSPIVLFVNSFPFSL